MENYLQVLQKYAVFSGRAARREYWMFFLVNLGICVAAGIVLGVLRAITHIDLTFILHLYSLAILCPGLGVSIRRLHDTDKSGLWLLLGLVPVIGPVAVLVFMAMDGTQGDNRFGASPKALAMNYADNTKIYR